MCVRLAQAAQTSTQRRQHAARSAPGVAAGCRGAQGPQRRHLQAERRGGWGPAPGARPMQPQRMHELPDPAHLRAGAGQALPPGAGSGGGRRPALQRAIASWRWRWRGRPPPWLLEGGGGCGARRMSGKGNPCNDESASCTAASGTNAGTRCRRRWRASGPMAAGQGIAAAHSWPQMGIAPASSPHSRCARQAPLKQQNPPPWRPKASRAKWRASRRGSRPCWAPRPRCAVSWWAGGLGRAGEAQGAGLLWSSDQPCGAASPTGFPAARGPRGWAACHTAQAAAAALLAPAPPTAGAAAARPTCRRSCRPALTAHARSLHTPARCCRATTSSTR